MPHIVSVQVGQPLAAQPGLGAQAALPPNCAQWLDRQMPEPQHQPGWANRWLSLVTEAWQEEGTGREAVGKGPRERPTGAV